MYLTDISTDTPYLVEGFLLCPEFARCRPTALLLQRFCLSKFFSRLWSGPWKVKVRVLHPVYQKGVILGHFNQPCEPPNLSELDNSTNQIVSDY